MKDITNCIACGNNTFEDVFNVKDYSISQEIFHVKECSTCSLRVTSHPPSENECGTYYQGENYISHSDTQSGLINGVYHIVRKLMLGMKYRLCRSKSIPKTLLDVGSGTGYFPNYMKNKSFQVMGIEVDENARKYSQNKFDIEVNSPFDLLRGGIDKKFGYITLWHVLEHLYQPEKYMDVFKKQLEDKGQLIMAVPNYLSFDAQHYKSHWAAYDVPRHLWHFTPQAMRLFAERSGFRIVKTKSMPFDPFYNSMLSSKYRQDAFPIVWGFVIGLISFFMGIINVNKASSIIYVMQKND